MVQSRKPLAALLVVFGTVLLILFGAALLAHYRRSSNSLAQPAGSANSSVANTDNSSAANADNSPTVNGNNPPANGGSYSPAEQPPPTVTIPAGTEIVVRLEDSLSSSRNRRGDSFVASLAEPLIIDNYIVAPEDSKLTGRVVAARESGHLKTPADLAITLTSLELGNESYQIETTHYGRRAQGHAKHNAKWIAGLAGGGALLGALVGHGKGAAIGAGIGGGAGTATAYATGKKDIYFPAEMRVRFRLEQPVTVMQAG
ncbi:MAG: hypothetical protein LAP13_23725 [Acidobacteriia bacterium]|nr:hypothetical protein [Terriglobia bacterium]